MKGPIFKLLSSEIGYVDMQRLENSMIDSMLNTFKNTKGFVMDMRGYPKGTAWTRPHDLALKIYWMALYSPVCNLLLRIFLPMATRSVPSLLPLLSCKNCQLLPTGAIQAKR